LLVTIYFLLFCGLLIVTYKIIIHSNLRHLLYALITSNFVKDSLQVAPWWTCIQLLHFFTCFFNLLCFPFSDGQSLRLHGFTFLGGECLTLVIFILILLLLWIPLKRIRIKWTELLATFNHFKLIILCFSRLLDFLCYISLVIKFIGKTLFQ